MENRRHYEVLGLTPDASSDQVKEAYHELIKQWHPDKVAHNTTLQAIAQEEMKRINSAYEALKSHKQTETDSFSKGSTQYERESHAAEAAKRRAEVEQRVREAERQHREAERRRTQEEAEATYQREQLAQAKEEARLKQQDAKMLSLQSTVEPRQGSKASGLPVTCRRQGCNRQRISLSVFCELHHNPGGIGCILPVLGIVTFIVVLPFLMQIFF